MSIPRIIHHVFLSSLPLSEALKKEEEEKERIRFNSKYRVFRQSWFKYHGDFNFAMWTLKELTNFLTLDKNCAEILCGNFPYVIKSDIARFIILYWVGGVYVDTDMEAVNNISKLMECKSFAGESYPPNGIGNAIVGGEPHNELFLEIAKRSAMEVLQSKEQAIRRPDLYGVQIAGKMLKDVELIYPRKYFYPFSWKELEKRENTWFDSYAVHHWYGMNEDGWTNKKY